MVEWVKVGEHAYEWDGDYEMGRDPLPPEDGEGVTLIINGALTWPIYHYTEPGRIWIDEKRDLYRIPEDERYYV